MNLTAQQIARALSEPVTTLARAHAEDAGVSWIEAMIEGDHPDPNVGDVVHIDRNYLQTIERNFNTGVRGIDIMTDYEHGHDVAKGSQASGKLVGMRMSERDGKSVLEWGIQWNADAAAEIKAGKWRYFSAQYMENYPKAVGKSIKWIKNVAIGGALTNKPVVKGMRPVNLSEFKDELAEFKDDPEVGAALDVLENVAPPAKDGTPDPNAREEFSSIGMEHSEPDEGGGQPQPREQDSPIGTPAPTLPGKADNDPSNDGQNNGGSRMEVGQLLPLFGIAADASDDDIAAAAKALREDASVARAASEAADENAAFAKKYPERARRMAELEARDLIARSREFAESYEKFEAEDEKGVKREYGFAPVVVEKISDMARSFHEGDDFDLTKVDEVLRTIARTPDKGIIEFGERGSSQQVDNSPESGSRRFSELVTKLEDEDKMNHLDAMREAARRSPADFVAFQEKHKTVSPVAANVGSEV